MALEQLRNVALWIAKGDLWPDWEKESDPEVRDLALIAVFAVLFPTARFFLDKFVFEPIGRSIINGQDGNVKKGAFKSHHRAQMNLTKFKESAWKCVYYFSAEVFALAITYNEPWFTDSKQFWVGPGEQHWPNQMTRLKLKVLYGFAGGFYTYSIFALMFWETRRADFGVSLHVWVQLCWQYMMPVMYFWR